MNPQDIVSLVAAFGAAILGIMPVYQKWREIRRSEAVADREKGVDTSIRLNPLKEAIEEISKDKYNLFTLFLGLIISFSLVWNVVRGSYVVGLVERHYEAFQQVEKNVNDRMQREQNFYNQVTKYHEEHRNTLKRIEEKLDQRK